MTIQPMIDQLEIIKKACGSDCPVLVGGFKSRVTAAHDKYPVPVLAGKESEGEELWCWSIDRKRFDQDQNTESQNEEDFMIVNPLVFTIRRDEV